MLSAVGKEPREKIGAQERGEMINEKVGDTEQRADIEGLDLGKRDTSSCGTGEGGED